MRFVTFDDHRIGLLDADEVVDLTSLVPGWGPDDALGMNRFISAFPALRAGVERGRTHLPRKPLSETRLLAPVPAPGHVLVKGTNYREHVSEMQRQGLLGQRDASEDLGFFLKASASISGPEDPIRLPLKHFPGRRFDHESEIAFVIGAEARAVPPERAIDHIFGFTMMVDVTLRNVVGGNVTPVLRKSFETFSPMGPCIVTADEIADPNDIDIRLSVNGEERQHGNTGEMIIKIADLLSRASHVFPLRAGDVYTTGSPSGVGPLHPGDTLVISSPQIGSMTLPVTERDW
jgi:2-keto-4-pentenoate hydratase/2-oxohepta-3-ene-1,7-dioic acid hydratase in catechol pathway